MVGFKSDNDNKNVICNTCITASNRKSGSAQLNTTTLDPSHTLSMGDDAYSFLTLPKFYIKRNNIYSSLQPRNK
jgi:hypothetical protein